MPINYATKFEKKTSDLVKAGRKSKKFTNQEWNWDGVDTIKVTTLVDPDIVDYQPNGDNRYGNSSEVEDTQQSWQVQMDRAWSKTMDKKNIDDAMGIRKPGKYLAQVTKNKFIPEMDTYMFQILAVAAQVYGRNTIVAAGATTAANAFSNFTALTAQITDDEMPEENRIAAMTSVYYNLLKQGGYIVASEAAYKTRQTGNLGEVDNVEVVIVPSKRMPSFTDLIISHDSVLVAPEKLEDYKIHDNPKGISGYLIEYRHRYDGFADINHVNSIGVHKTQ